MKSTNSFKFNRSLKPVIKSDLRNLRSLYIILPILTVVFTLIWASMCGIMDSELYLYDENGLTTVTDCTRDFSAIIGICGGLLLILFGIIAALLQYRYLWNKRTVDFFQSLAVTRKSQYLSKSFSGIVLMAEAYIAEILSTLMIVEMAAEENKNIVINSGYCIRLYTVILFCAAASFLISSTVAVVSSKTWHYILLTCCIVGALGFCLSCLFLIPSSFIAGVKQSSVQTAIISPLACIVIAVNSTEIRFRYIILAMVIVSVIAYFFGQQLYLKRKNECAESHISSRLYIGLAVFSVQIPSYIAAFSTDTAVSNCGRIIIHGIINSVISTIIFSLLLQKKVMTKNIAVQTVAMAAILSGVTLICANGFSGYSSQMPDLDEIESIDYFCGSKSNILDIIMGESYYDSFKENTQLTFKEQESFEAVLKLHQMCMEDFEHKYVNDTGYDMRVITYHLKDGTDIKRYFYEYYSFVPNFTDDVSQRSYSKNHLIKATTESKQQDQLFQYSADDLLMFSFDSDPSDSYYKENTEQIYQYVQEALMQQTKEDLDFMNSDSYYDSPSEIGKSYVNLYFISKSADEETRRQLKKMTLSELSTYYFGNYVDIYCFQFTESAEKLIEYAQNSGFIPPVTDFEDIQADDLSAVNYIPVYQDPIASDSDYSIYYERKEEHGTYLYYNPLWTENMCVFSKNLTNYTISDSATVREIYKTVSQDLDRYKQIQEPESQDSCVYLIWFELKDGSVSRIMCVDQLDETNATINYDYDYSETF